MTPLSISQPAIENLFTTDNGMYSIPYYQRPYSWTEDQCFELWSDLVYFAFPNGRADDFNPKQDAYFLGNMVTYPNGVGKSAVVDGQQRIISLLLLMRALYAELQETENGRQLSKCIWHFEEDGTIDTRAPRIETNAICEENKLNLVRVLMTGAAPKADRSRPAINYRFFSEQIRQFKESTPNNLEKLAARLLRNVYVSRMEATSEEQALQLFITINDRGIALRVEDIFQAKLYEDAKLYGGDESSALFTQRWATLCGRCKKIFDDTAKWTPTEFAFLLYAHSQRENVTWKTLKDVYGAHDYALLKSDTTIKSIERLLDFLFTVYAVKKHPALNQREDLLQAVHTLFRCDKTATWYVLSWFFFSHNANHDENYWGELLRLIKFVLAYWVRSAIAGESHRAFQRYYLMEHCVLCFPEVSSKLKLSEGYVRQTFAKLFEIKSLQRAQKTLLSWWTFYVCEQPRMSWNTRVDIEHIFAKDLSTRRQLANPDNIQLVGNLAFLESSYNRNASNCTFADKKKSYAKSANKELQKLIQEFDDFGEAELLARNQTILERCVGFLREQGFLLQ